MDEKMQHAIVAGGSMAGLLAARVLADHADRVTIIDRDVLPDRPQRRPGVPQSAHVHALLPGGEAVIERLLPGIGAEIAAAGSPVVDLAQDIDWVTPAGRGVRVPSSLRMFTCTREVLEWAVRRRVLALPQVDVRNAVGVAGLVARSGSVCGVELDNGGVLTADVVVDASGRASRAPSWLHALGYDAPRETIVDANLGYASQVIEAPSDIIAGARAGYLQVAPPEHLRGAIAFPIQSGRWLLTLIGTGGDRPPRDQAGFNAFARSLRDPMFTDLVTSGRPDGPIAVFGATANRYRHYEKLRNRPAGFIVTGDAACAFNPVYGQGMSAAAMAADALARCLRRDPSPRALARRFPGQLQQAVKVPWMMATAADLDVAGVPSPLSVRATNRYVARVMAAGTHSAAARLRLLEVMGLVRPPQSLFAPRVVAAVLRGKAATEPGNTPAVAPAHA